MSQVIHPCAGVGAISVGTHMSFGPADGLLGPAGQVIAGASFAVVGCYLLAAFALSALVVGRRLGSPFAARGRQSTSCEMTPEGHP